MAAHIYCPYTDKDIALSCANKEHIIPLSLGGSNSFVLPVSSVLNAEAGSDIDGALASDFLVLFRRRHFDARGHSNKRPVVLVKQSRLEDGSRPVQVEFGREDGLRVFDPVLKRNLSEEAIAGKQFSSKITIPRFSRLKFVAKVALAAGYYVFGEWFRQSVRHEEVRALMNFNGESEKKDFDGFGLKVIDEFTPPETKDVEQLALERFFCQTVAGSCVYFVPGPVNIGITVGILGQHVATLNVPANTDTFPFSDENDLGHAVLIENGTMNRMSYRQLARKVYEHIPIQS